MSDYVVDGEFQKELCRAWRLLDAMRLVDTVFNHISISTGPFTFITNPVGVYGRCLTPGQLVSLDGTGKSLNGKTANPDGVALHAAIHSIRHWKPTVAIHLHTGASIAVASSPRGLLPISQTAMEFVDKIKYLDYEGLFGLVENVQATLLRNSLGLEDAFFLLRNHGLLVVASSVAEAVYSAYYLNLACEYQLQAMSIAGSDVLLPNAVVARAAADELSKTRAAVALDFYRGSLIALLGSDS